MTTSSWWTTANVHRKIFFSIVSNGPYTCIWCGLEIQPKEVYIHHLNHDHDDNAINNLIPMHHSCHMSYHATERWKDPEYKYRVGTAISAARMGHEVSTETRAKISAANTGKKHTEDTKQRISATLKDHEPEFCRNGHPYKDNRIANGPRTRCGRCHSERNMRHYYKTRDLRS